MAERPARLSQNALHRRATTAIAGTTLPNLTAFERGESFGQRQVMVDIIR
jgi:hypothetical protein